MSYYKDYGSPATTNTTDRLAAEDAYSPLLQATQLGDGLTAQYPRSAEAPPNIAARHTECRAKIKTAVVDANAVAISLGDLNVVQDFSERTGDETLRIELKELGTGEILTILFDKAAGTISAAEDQVLENDGTRASGNDTLVITAENSNSGSSGDATDEIVVSLDGNKNLLISPGSAIATEKFYEVRRLNDTEALKRVADGITDDITENQTTALLDKYGIGLSYSTTQNLVGADPYAPPTGGSVDGRWIGWVLSMVGANITDNYEEVVEIPVGWGDAPNLNTVSVKRIEASTTVQAGVTLLPNGGALRSNPISDILQPVLDGWGAIGGAAEEVARLVRKYVYANAPYTTDEVLPGLGYVEMWRGTLQTCSGDECTGGPICEPGGFCYSTCNSQPRNTQIVWDGTFNPPGTSPPNAPIGVWRIKSCVDPCTPSNGECLCLTGCTPFYAAYWWDGRWYPLYEEIGN